MLIAPRPPRKCSIVGDGIVTFGVRVVADFRNSKSRRWIGREWRTLPVTCMIGGAKSTLPALLWKLIAIPPLVSTPSSCVRKSMWK